MFENQIVQKSSDNSTGISSTTEYQQESGRIYFETLQALQDFDSAPTIDQAPEVEVADPRIAKYLASARVLIQHRELPLALNLLRQASNIDSKNIATLTLLAQCLDKMHRYQEMLTVRKALVDYDFGYRSLHQLASTLYKLGRDDEALDKYFEALAVLNEEDDSLFEIYKNMGNIFVRRGDFDGAEEYYNKAYTMNPSSDVLLVNFGTLQVQVGDFDKSLYCFRKAVEVNPENDKAWVGLALVHNQFSDIELAWANLESALDINPANRTAVHLAANWATRDGLLVKGIDAIQNYLGTVEEDEEMSLVLINLLCAAGNIEHALIEIERVLLWNPDHKEVRELKKKLIKAKQAA
jgi:tetratricopeptide (TPR) repeat protein